MTECRVSVRTLVETVLRSGDLSPGASRSRLLEGIAGHLSLQAQPGAQNEVALSLTVTGQRVRLSIHGRIDRLYPGPLIEEIKTTLHDPDALGEDQLHWAQAETYGHMLCVKEGFERVDIRLTYLNLSDGTLARYTRSRSASQLADRFSALVAPYLTHLDAQAQRREALWAQLMALPFPFPAYRAGQRALAGQVYVALRDQKLLLAQAPTGTGKTMAVLFPALKALGEGRVERLFYLTARTTTQQAALDALRLLAAPGLRAIVLYAREKVCACGTPRCAQGDCPRQIGYYDRLEQGLIDLFALPPPYVKENLTEVAQRHSLCPFEFGLDAALECDLIIGDYNYAFDPRVRLQRFFSGGRANQALLVDEAHNLPDRARAMYSAPLNTQLMKDYRKSVPKTTRRSEAYKALRGAIGAVEALYAEQEAPFSQEQAPETLRAPLQRLAAALEAPDKPGDPALAQELFFQTTGFLYALEHYDGSCCMLYEGGKTRRLATLLCRDPSGRLRDSYKKCRGVILFSATLSPFGFYRALCGAGEDAPCLALPTPFPPENLRVLLYPVNTRYAARQATLPLVVRAASALCHSRAQGNFLLFFPSHAYLRAALELLAPLLTDCEVICQTSRMDDAARAEFLDRFTPHPQGRLVGLAVLGGVFSEGIDLPLERLCAAAIVGMGLPQLCLEREVLRQHYEENYGDGFAYAYLYPGLGRVLQAAGRLIRTGEDRGLLLLLDDRYLSSGVEELLPAHWSPRLARSPAQVDRLCRDFFAD